MNPYNAHYPYRRLVRAYIAAHGHQSCLEHAEKPRHEEKPRAATWSEVQSCGMFDDAAHWATSVIEGWRLGVLRVEPAGRSGLLGSAANRPAHGDYPPESAPR